MQLPEGFTLNYKKLVWSIISGGLVYLIVSILISFLVQTAAPFNWAVIGGMRSFADPIMMWYFFYGFVLCIGAGATYQLINLKGKTTCVKGIKFGALMWLLVSVPSAFVVFTTMIYPIGFYLENFFGAFIVWLFVGWTIVCVNECENCSGCRLGKTKKKK